MLILPESVKLPAIRSYVLRHGPKSICKGAATKTRLEIPAPIHLQTFRFYWRTITKISFAVGFPWTNHNMYSTSSHLPVAHVRRYANFELGIALRDLAEVDAHVEIGHEANHSQTN